MYINTKYRSNTYDAIVIGSGISGGWAAKELCERGLKTLLLDRGRNVEHIKDYATANMNPWDFKYRLNHTIKEIRKNPIRSMFSNEDDKDFFVEDEKHPYIQEKPFYWVRGYQVGGRSLTWGRQCYRWSDLDFTSNLQNGVGVDWPIRYKDIEPWYNYVENYIGISGEKENLPHLPDSLFLPPMELNCVEKHFAQTLKEYYKDRVLTVARVANLTRGWNGRGPCRNRNLCSRGCPFAGYFSSNSATIPAAAATGNLTLKPFSIVSKIIYNEDDQRVTGVEVIDTLTNETIEYFAKIVFLNASTIASAAILLNSTSNRFPDGLGNDSKQIGHNLMDHHSSAGATGIHLDYKDFYYKGRRPCGFTIPRFRNIDNSKKSDFIGGYMIHGNGERREWRDQMTVISGFGSEYKKELTSPGAWKIWMAGWGECLPYYDNKISLDKEQTDSWGLPQIKINFSFKDNENKMIGDIMLSSCEMLEKAGFKDIDSFNYEKPGGATIHEMGTIRMGRDPKSSVLNRFNQMHSVKNLFVTDGSCMTSSACQSPSLTYMALTARACDYAVRQLKNGDL